MSKGVKALPGGRGSGQTCCPPPGGCTLGVEKERLGTTDRSNEQAPWRPTGGRAINQVETEANRLWGQAKMRDLGLLDLKESRVLWSR